MVRVSVRYLAATNQSRPWFSRNWGWRVEGRVRGRVRVRIP